MKQSEFDALVASMVKGIRDQGEPSIRGTACVYRGKNNKGGILKCAIGHGIPDEDYNPRFDGFAFQVGEIGNTLGWNLTAEQLIMLKRLQDAHDSAACSDAGNPGRFKAALEINLVALDL